MLRYLLALQLCLFLGMAAEPPTLEQSLSAKSVSSAEISPDGRYVAYLVTQADWDENDFVSQIWIANTATSETYQLTSGKKSSTSPRWSPDSHHLAFVSDRDGKRQIYTISPTGGEATQVTNEENGVTAFAWRPGPEPALAYTSTGPDPKPLKDRKEKYGDFTIIDGDYRMVHLWLLKIPADVPSNLKKLKPQPLTSGEQFSVGSFSWSPDGNRIAFSATREPDLGSQETEQLYIVDAADLHVKKLLETAGPNNNRNGHRTVSKSPSSPPTASPFSSLPTVTWPRFRPTEGLPRFRPATSTKIRISSIGGPMGSTSQLVRRPMPTFSVLIPPLTPSTDSLAPTDTRRSKLHSARITKRSPVSEPRPINLPTCSSHPPPHSTPPISPISTASGRSFIWERAKSSVGSPPTDQRLRAFSSSPQTTIPRRNIHCWLSSTVVPPVSTLPISPPTVTIRLNVSLRKALSFCVRTIAVQPAMEPLSAP